MYNNPYMQNYSQQSFNDKIDSQIAQLQQMKAHNMQPPAINQTFQLAPTKDVIRYANSIDEVQRDMVIGDTPYFSKDMSIVWIKNSKGEIKTYELNEIIPKDEKDIQIEFLQSQIEELRKEMKKYDANITNDNAKQDTTDTTTNDDTNGTTIKKSEPTGFQKVSRSKKE